MVRSEAGAAGAAGTAGAAGPQDDAALDERSPRGGPTGNGWFVWAVAVIPAMFILPMYVFPVHLGRPIGVYDGRRLLEILWVAGLLLALLRPSIRAASAAAWSRLSLTSRVAGVLFIAWALLSSLLSAAPAYALRELSMITLLLVVVFPLGAVLTARGTKVLEVLALTLLLYAILVFANPLDHGFAHPRILGHAVAVAVPALLFSGNLMLALLAAPALAVGILNGSRALGVVLIVVAVAALLLWPDRRRRMLPGLAGLALAMLLVAAFVLVGHDASLHEAVERGTSSTGRDYLWRETLQRFAQAPLLGEGPGLLARSPGLVGWAASPHNSVLLIAAETGVMGLICAGALVVQGLRRLPRLAAEYRPWGLALLAGGADSMFNGSILVPVSQSLLILALALVLPATPAGSVGAASRRTGWVLAIVGAVALGVLLATLSLPAAEFEGRLQSPRFFSPGIIP